MTVAAVLEPVLSRMLAGPAPVAVRCWDGSEFGPAHPPATVVLARRRALRRLLWAPNELGLARAYVSGDLRVDGDLFAGLAALRRAVLPDGRPPVLDRSARAGLLRTGLRLGVVGPPPPLPAEEARLSGSRHSRGRDAAAISHHYDVGSDFYRLILGESMTYSCAYWERDPGADYTLADAQTAKCDLVARKLGLAEGMRVLDVGCGWGTFALHAATRYRARVVGVTLSHAQADHARRRVAEAGVADRVEIRIQDYRDVPDGPYDAISSIGMAEHVGAAQLAGYAADLFRLLRPRGRLLNHAIACRPGRAATSGTGAFISRYVFPDGELVPVATTVQVLEDTGFEVRDVEALRESYALTLRAWVANLERHWDDAVHASSLGRARVWRLYMAASALAFEANRLGVNQVLAVRPDDDGRGGMPRTRAALLGADRSR